jgi:hypothetical protein
MALQSFFWGGGGALASFRFFILYTVGKTPWSRISLSQELYVHIGKHTQNKYTEASMSRVGFKSITPSFERAKAVHTLERMATVMGRNWNIYKHTHTLTHKPDGRGFQT